MDATKAGSVEAAFRRALRAAASRDWTAAEAWLERIVQADSTDLDAYFALARIYRDQGDVGRAIRMHQNLLLRPKLDRRGKDEALLELARDFDAGGFRDRAIAGYEEVLAVRPRDPEVIERLAALSLENRDIERGLALAKKLRRIDRPKADRLEVELSLADARARAAEGDADGGIKAAKRAVKRNAGCDQGWSLLGELEAERGRDAKAIAAWQKAVEAAPESNHGLYAKIEAGFAARNKTAAFEKWVAARIDAAPKDAGAHLALANLRAGKGENAAAIEGLSRAVERAPESTSLQVALGRMLLESGQEAEASKAYAALLDALDQGAASGSQGAADVGARGNG